MSFAERYGTARGSEQVTPPKKTACYRKRFYTNCAAIFDGSLNSFLREGLQL
jgi:hypothetical protein